MRFLFGFRKGRAVEPYLIFVCSIGWFNLEHEDLNEVKHKRAPWPSASHSLDSIRVSRMERNADAGIKGQVLVESSKSCSAGKISSPGSDMAPLGNVSRQPQARTAAGSRAFDPPPGGGY